MTSPSWRRFGASVAAVATTATLALAVAPAHAAAPAADASGANWLAAQLTDGAFAGQYGPDYGLSVDTAFALQATGGHAGDVSAVEGALQAHLGDYITGEAYGDTGSTYSGSAAKALVFAETVGADATSFGGVDLVSRVEDQVTTSGPSQGRLFDTSSYGDYANSIGQAFAARGLDAAGSDDAAEVLDFLLEQQCSAGYFRLGFATDTDAADQTCDGGLESGASPADPDTTSLVILQLEPLAQDDPTVAAALAAAKSWLAARQHADGSFNGGTSTDVPNANSTGLAGWALGELGDTAAAAKAARWIRNHQVQPLAGCATKVDTESGAVAYDTADLTAGRKSGIGDDVRSKWLRASSQSVPALQWLPATTNKPTLTAPSGYVKASTKVTLRAAHGQPGGAICLGVGSVRSLVTANTAGAASATVKLPAGTANRVAHLTDGTTTRTATVKVLGAKHLSVKATKKVKRGKKATVKISGLAPKEKLTVLRGSKVVKHAKAGAHGKFHLKVAVGKKAGKVTIKVKGQFPAIRTGKTHVKVTR